MESQRLVLTQTLIAVPERPSLAPFIKVVFLAQNWPPVVEVRMTRPCVTPECSRTHSAQEAGAQAQLLDGRAATSLGGASRTGSLNLLTPEGYHRHGWWRQNWTCIEH